MMSPISAISSVEMSMDAVMLYSTALALSRETSSSSGLLMAVSYTHLVQVRGVHIQVTDDLAFGQMGKGGTDRGFTLSLIHISIVKERSLS